MFKCRYDYMSEKYTFSFVSGTDSSVIIFVFKACSYKYLYLYCQIIT